MPSSPPRISAAATPEGRLMVRVRMEKPSFRTRLRRGRDLSSPFHASAAAALKGRPMVGVRMEKPSFRTPLNSGRDALISISCLSGRNSRGQAYGGGEDGGAQLPDSSAGRP
ncbi:hypothetical protein MRX96_045868 [Rhipicephalus microplus]